MCPSPTQLLIVLGPTAAGKESASVHAAEALDAELVMADSVKAYRGLEIAAAAPPPEHTARIPHHIVGCLDTRERLHVALWVEMAERAIADVRARGKTPLIVGGTALYLKALLFGLFDGPPADEALRERLRRDEARTPGSLHARLTDVDPAASERIHQNDLKRILRALEVYEKTGRPISDIQQEWGGAPRIPYRAVGLRRTREDLRARIERRIERMVDEGLLAEITERVAAGDLGPTAAEAIGVKELLDIARTRHSGEREEAATLAAALESVRAHTWQLARRQITWWKRFPDIHWLDVEPDETPAAVGARVAQALVASS